MVFDNVAECGEPNFREAFESYEAEILRFPKNADCLIANDFTERSTRSSKIKQNISGTYAVPNMPPPAAIHTAR